VVVRTQNKRTKTGNAKPVAILGQARLKNQGLRRRKQDSRMFLRGGKV